MSYYNPQGGYARPPPPPQPPYGAQPGHASYSTPPPFPPHPPHQSPYPTMNQGYGQPGYGQQPGGYGPPPTHSPYPPQQQGYGAPPIPPHPGYGAPPPGGYAPPPGPPGQYGAPPPGPPPGHHHSGSYGAPPAPYGAPPPGGAYGAAPPPSGPPAPPSLGYVPGQTAPVDMSREADALRSAMKGFGTNERALIDVLARLDPLQVASVRQAFTARHRRDLISDLEKETSGYFRDGLVAIARGPLDQDCINLNKAIKGLGTKETVLNDILLGRSNADMRAITAHYQHLHHRSLESDLRGDLSMKTERLFTMIVAARRAEESTPIIPQQIEADISELYRATEGSKIGTDQITVCSILSSRSDGQIRALSQAYVAKYHRKLSEVLRKNFSGHMEDALLFMLEAAEDKAKHDASLLEAAMKGMGTKDELLVNRLVRIHWDKARLVQCRNAYRHFYKTELADRVRGETRGDYEKLMVAVVQSA
ncbi:hypothetical protein AAFC00_000941 [Neodothiora populina]|uniref:Annexin n=1 Tax=Neodothiora populina TaxID=2781224 RepID=A0ABR3PMA5_9PEZI